jgi:hypothetical protein
MSHDADVFKVQTALEHRVCPIPFLGLVYGETHVLGSSQDFQGASRHGFHIVHEAKSLFHQLRVAAHVFETKHGITMTGQVVRLREIRVPVTAPSV